MRAIDEWSVHANLVAAVPHPSGHPTMPALETDCIYIPKTVLSKVYGEYTFAGHLETLRCTPLIDNHPLYFNLRRSPLDLRNRVQIQTASYQTL